MNNGYQLTGTDTCVTECRSILLYHLQQLRTVALNHALHAVFDELNGLVAALTELRHQGIGCIDSIAEFHIVGIAQCPHGVCHAVGFITFQSCCDLSYLVLLCQFCVVASPRLRCLADNGDAGTYSCSQQCRLRGQQLRGIGGQSEFVSDSVEYSTYLSELATACQFLVDIIKVFLGSIQTALQLVETLGEILAEHALLFFVGHVLIHHLRIDESLRQFINLAACGLADGLHATKGFYKLFGVLVSKAHLNTRLATMLRICQQFLTGSLDLRIKLTTLEFQPGYNITFCHILFHFLFYQIFYQSVQLFCCLLHRLLAAIGEEAARGYVSAITDARFTVVGTLVQKPEYEATVGSLIGQQVFCSATARHTVATTVVALAVGSVFQSVIDWRYWSTSSSTFLAQDADVTAQYSTIHSRLHSLVCLAGVGLHHARLVCCIADLTPGSQQYLTNQALHLLLHCRV